MKPLPLKLTIVEAEKNEDNCELKSKRVAQRLPMLTPKEQSQEIESTCWTQTPEPQEVLVQTSI